MKLWRITFALLAAFSLASCGSDEPRYADPEAHEKMVKLNELYGPLIHKRDGSFCVILAECRWKN